ncbi:MAG: hypothetical protein AB7E85_09590 [Pseudobdellovibrionaceae bacterium]
MSNALKQHSLLSDLKILGLVGAFGATVGTLIHDGMAIREASVAATLQSELVSTGTLESLPNPGQIIGATQRQITAKTRMTDSCLEETGISALDYYSVRLRDRFTVSFRHKLDEADSSRMLACLVDKQNKAEHSRFIQLG